MRAFQEFHESGEARRTGVNRGEKGGIVEA